MMLNSFDIIILDCDGVVFDSNLLKVTAFREVLSDYSIEIVEEFCSYFKNNFGTSRYSLVKVFIVDILKQEFDEKLYKKILHDYGEKCISLYKKLDFTNELLRFLFEYKNKKLYIASGSDEKELNAVFKARDIDRKFEKILGSPRVKIELISDISLKNPDKRIVMIGDAESDFLASKDNNIDFIFMSQYSLVRETMTQLSLEHGFETIMNLGDLIDE